jgi:DNA-binding NarL/FixJ family response regulator
VDVSPPGVPFPPRRVLLVEDADWMQRSLGDFIQQTPGLKLVGATATAEASRVLMQTLLPDVVMLDALLPGIGGLSFCRELKAGTAPPRILLMSVRESVEMLAESVAAQSDGFVSKNRGWEVLREALLTVAAGTPWFDPGIPRSRQLCVPVPALTREAARMRVKDLTPRQHRYLDLLSQGLTYKEVAKELEVNPQSVNTHMLHIRERLGTADNREALALWKLAKAYAA